MRGDEEKESTIIAINATKKKLENLITHNIFVFVPHLQGYGSDLRFHFKVAIDGLARSKASRTADAADVAGVVLTSLVTIPDWPVFNSHPLSWLEPSEAKKHPKPQPAKK
ncbi:probable signal peptidase complex subunit 1 [Phtheirospermum japonicum]|uniref:Signal peptidase complex subunit 1 n=1 Tax=Phtheirospermum japonicum TaxID=374723 RepID=A0A830CFL9_9LAMI|nr:probable signal peptidase complex subunit 1 [Phtheirospermum japonicum]